MLATAPPVQNCAVGDVSIYACDVGSVAQGNFWWCSSHEGQEPSSDVRELSEAIVSDIRTGFRVAVGVECPLFIPCPSDLGAIGRARQGECGRETGNKPYNTSVGACAVMTGLPPLGWVLREVRDACPGTSATTNINEFRERRSALFLWEAFVSGREATGTHHGDALRAMQAFQSSWRRQVFETRVTCDGAISLAGALILWAGLSLDTSLLHQQSLVLRPIFAAE
jgi:hypothetical protein